MSRLLAVSACALLASLAAAGARAQNLVISNARVIVGPGKIVENGTVVVRDGLIASVSATAAPAPKGVTAIDGTGMTVMAGFIDDHRHIVNGPADAFISSGRAAKEMLETLEAGITTVQSGGDNDAAVLALKKAVDGGQFKGPRIITSGRVPTAGFKSEDEVRAAIRKVIAAGADSIAEVHYPILEPAINIPSEQESRNLAAAIDEAKKQHINCQVHAVSPAAMVRSAELGGVKQVHTPQFGWMTEAEAKRVKDAGAQVASCAGFGVPVFGIYNQDNKPTFRDGKPWPSGILNGEGQGREAGYKAVNARTLYDAGVVFGFCTDTQFAAPAAMAHELRALSLTFSPIDLIPVLGPNSAAFIDKTDRGTLEPGKLADMVVLAGNPLEGYWNLLNPKIVIKGGVIEVDKRPAPAAKARR